jgi:hypothetical protein
VQDLREDRSQLRVADMTQSPAERRYVRMAGAMNAKAARLGQYGRLQASDLATAFLRAEGRCTYCDIGIDPLHCSFDHVNPFDRGGLNQSFNIVACCMTCQRSKSTKLPDEYHKARTTVSKCEVCGIEFKPRWADYSRGYGRTCSRACSGKKGGETKNPAASPEGQGPFRVASTTSTK